MLVHDMRMSVNIQRQILRYSVAVILGLFIIFQVWKIKSSNHPSNLDYDVSINEPKPTLESFLPGLRRRRSVTVPTNRHTIVTKRHYDTTKYQNLPTSHSKSMIHFPHGSALRPLKQILSAGWVTALQLELTKLAISSNNSRHVSVVTSNSKYMLSLLNWLIAAQIHMSPPISNIIIISLDRNLQDLLHKKSIPSVYVDPNTVIRPETKMKNRNSHIWITRCAIYRLLNYWGYDVAVYDSDAIVLKNLQPIFEAHRDSDVIGSAGTYPFPLGRTWGQTFCMGVALFRSTQRTDFLWEAMTQTKSDTFDDQVKLNYALEDCHIKWQSGGRSIQNQAITGQCSENLLGGLKVTILPETVVCRKCLYEVHDNSYYVWHRMTKKSGNVKVKRAQEGSVWYLKDDWNISSSLRRETHQLTGLEWLKTISKP